MATTVDLEFEKCLKRNKIRIFYQGKSLASKELKAAQSDFKAAKETFKRRNYKWATIQCYYSMFHSARALLYVKNFREKSHRCLIIALRVFYVNKNKLKFQLIEALEKAKMLREEADYYDRWSKETTQTLLSSAEEFLREAKNILIL